MPETDSIQMWSYRVEVMDPGDIAGYSIHAVDGEIGRSTSTTSTRAIATCSSTRARGSSERR